VADGYGTGGRGKRFDHGLEVYRHIWQGNPVGGSPNPAVPPGTRDIPLLFGAGAPAAFERMARWGQGYIGASLPPEMIAGSFDKARDAWRKAGREGSPRLVAIAYFALGDAETGREKIYDYYSVAGDAVAGMVGQGARDSAWAVKETVTAFGDLGADELIFNTSTDDINEVFRLAEIVL
jgi:alkanesulfonate monooxygenase SsuD/methylene tetrahydromethanopterin reductase-like flavin-dependent oxidoreductase (luciferase family)